MRACAACGREWAEKRQPGFREECESCLNPLHACRNCRFFQEGASQWCGEPMARDEKPRDPEAANTCSYFLLGEADRGETETRAAAAKAELAALFGDAPAEDESAKPDWMRFERPASTAEEIFKPPDDPPPEG